MKKLSADVVTLRISGASVQADFVERASDADPGGSFTVIVHFDARSGALSAWPIAPPGERHASGAGYRRPPFGLAALSTREAEVLQRLMLGEADKEIARVMELSTGTVKVHVKAIIRKLGVANRTQAAIRALGRYWSSVQAVNEDGGH